MHLERRVHFALAENVSPGHFTRVCVLREVQIYRPETWLLGRVRVPVDDALTGNVRTEHE